MMTVGLLLRPWVKQMPEIGVQPRIFADDLLIVSYQEEVDKGLGLGYPTQSPGRYCRKGPGSGHPGQVHENYKPKAINKRVSKAL